MRVFISWSGPRSKHLADALRSWLPKVLQSVKPWMSEEDIAAGSRWLPEVSGELSAARVGILCVTPENQSAPWLVFEAGALSKTLEQTYVCPLLFDLELGQLSGPLAQFQASRLARDGVMRLIETLNGALGPAGLQSEALAEVFDVWWPKLEAKIAETPALETPRTPRRGTEELLEEILALTREQLRRENVRLEHAQARDDRVDEMLPIFEQMAGAAKEMQRRASEIAPILQQLPIDLSSMLPPPGFPAGKMEDMMEMMKKAAQLSRVEKHQLLNPPKDIDGGDK